MKLSMRSRYGFRAVLEIASEYEKNPVSVGIIAERQDISRKYLEQIITALKFADIVRSIRGPRGGYVLARPPSQIQLSELFLALEGPPISTECLQHPQHCPRCSDCVTRSLWMEMQDAMMGILESKTLQDMVDRLGENKENTSYQI